MAVILSVDAEQQSVEDIATSAEDAEPEPGGVHA